MLREVLQRIQKRLKALDLSESRASTMAGLSNSAIRNIRRAVEDGKSQGVSINTLIALAPILNTSVAWLAEGVGREEGAAVEQDRVDIPIVAWVSAGQMEGHESIEDISDLPTISAYGLPQGQWVALRVDGQSMNKISPHNSIILVNMSEKDLVSNAYYVIADETGQATYKRYRPNENPPFQPFSTQEIKPPKLEGQIRVIGRVRRTVTEM